VEGPLVLSANRGISKREARLLQERTGQVGVRSLALGESRKQEASAH
jgi:hypothetical protein